LRSRRQVLVLIPLEIGQGFLTMQPGDAMDATQTKSCPQSAGLIYHTQEFYPARIT
jgi:hypothetical protein